jgi:4-hydroxy-tetrahydrodipicolinate synthase
MTYGLYEGFRIVAKGLRSLDRHVAILGALASRFHEYNATGYFDGTLSGFWNFAFEPMLDHLEAWRRRDLEAVCRIWNGGLVQLHEYVADMGRLQVRSQTATWLRGLIPNPFVRPPMPRPRQIEIDTIYELLKNLGLSVIDRRDAAIDVSAAAASVK